MKTYQNDIMMGILLVVIITTSYYITIILAIPELYTFAHYMIFSSAYGGYVTLRLFVFVLKRQVKKNGGVLRI